MSNRPHETNIATHFNTFPGFDPNAMLQAFTPQMNGGASFGGNAFAGWIEMNKHWSAFLMKRFQEDSALVHRLATCTDLAGVGKVYSEFFQKTLEDYQTEFTEMGRLGQGMLGDVMPAAKN